MSFMINEELTQLRQVHLLLVWLQTLDAVHSKSCSYPFKIMPKISSKHLALQPDVAVLFDRTLSRRRSLNSFQFS